MEWRRLFAFTAFFLGAAFVLFSLDRHVPPRYRIAFHRHIPPRHRRRFRQLNKAKTDFH